MEIVLPFNCANLSANDKVVDEVVTTALAGGTTTLFTATLLAVGLVDFSCFTAFGARTGFSTAAFTTALLTNLVHVNFATGFTVVTAAFTTFFLGFT